MKSLADMICKSNDPEFADIRSLLVLPDANHSSQEMCSKFDRYILHRELSDAVSQEVRRREVEGTPLPILSQPRPAKDGWLEIHSEFGRIGVLWKGEAPNNLIFVADNYSSSKSGMFVFSVSVSPLGLISIDGDTPRYRNLGRGEMHVIGGFEVALAIINSPRTATVERVSPRMGVGYMRSAQRGVPMFSFNSVKLNRPPTSIQRHETQGRECQYSVRAHNVRGHWRLYVPKDDFAYWVWIDGYVAGNHDLGFVVKEHHVTASSQSTRKGFIVPNGPGIAGKRVPASRGSYDGHGKAA